MSRLTSLFRLIPDAVRPFLRYDHRPLLTLACLDVSTWRLPEPGILSSHTFKAQRYPEKITVLGNKLMVIGNDPYCTAYDLTDCSSEEYDIAQGEIRSGSIRSLKTMDNQLLILSAGPLMYHGTQRIKLKCDWRAIRCVCLTPRGFVVSANEPTDQPVDWRERAPGILQFYYDGVCTHTVHTYYAWYSLTWVGQGHIAFAATRLLNGICEVTLLCMDGEIYDVLKHHVPTGELIGISIVYDPKWNEYIVSGEKRILAFTHINDALNVREIYEYKPSTYSPYLHSLVLHDRTLFVCIRNKHRILQLELN
jgi:hypothetical protein